MTLFANPLGEGCEGVHEKVLVGKDLVAQAIRVKILEPFRACVRGECPDEWADVVPVKPLIDRGDARDCREAEIVRIVVAAESAYIIESAGNEANDITTGDQISSRGRGVLFGYDGFVKSRRKRVDQIHRLGELLVLFRRDLGRDEDSQMSNALMERVDDGLPVGAQLVVAAVEIEYPAERLLRRGDVVAE